MQRAGHDPEADLQGFLEACKFRANLFNQIATMLARGFSLEFEEVAAVLAPLRAREKEDLRRLVALVAYELEELAWEAGDGGSSPLKASTYDIPHCPPSEPSAADELRRRQEEFLRRRRHLRERAILDGRLLQKRGVCFGHEGAAAPHALERFRLKLLMSLLHGRWMARESTIIPSRSSIGADYLFLMLLRRHDPAFRDWEGVFAPSLAALTLPVESGVIGTSPDAARLPNPVIALLHAPELASHVENCEDRYACANDNDRETRRGLIQEILMCLFLLAGMFLEHGHEAIKSTLEEADQWFDWQHLMYFLRTEDPDVMLVWGALLELAWRS